MKKINYPTVKIKDYVFFQEGPGLRTYQWTKQGMKVITIGMVTKEGNIDISFTDKHISLDEFNSKYKHFAIEENDIVITTSGVSYGKISKIKKEHLPMMMNTSVIRFHSNSTELDHDYLYAYLRSSHFKNQIDGYALGSAQPNFGPSHINMMDMILPPMSIQKRISSIINSLDKQIEIKQKINETLGEMIMTLYKHWFVDFGPFQDGEFVNLDNHIIPKGWVIKKLSDVVNISTKSVNPSKLNDISLRHYSIPAFDSGMSPSIDLPEEIKSNKYLIEKDTILVSKLNPATPRIWTVFHKEEDNSLQVSSTEFIHYIPKDKKYFSWLNGYLRSFDFQSEFISYATGSTNSRQRVKPNVTKEFEIILPPEDVLEKFNKVVSTFYKLSGKNINTLSSLTATRDYLIPRLISGEIDIPEVVEKVREVISNEQPEPSV
ncbi:restriction endonuclease subunit S [Virgibacillus kekensis]|uniref:Restriction endonuclease subunit S n=1 Tax=Virgibacillus kekensis TaxID=202261 RepID=A0ABV9DK78_9BACI